MCAGGAFSRRRANARLTLSSCFVLLTKMDQDTLLTYPYVRFRLACRYCKRTGAYRLVRLAVKFGCDAKTHDVMVRLAADCAHWRRNKRWPDGCGVYLPDL